MLHIPFLDLKQQYRSIKPDIDHAIQSVIDECAFVGGRFVDAFESAFAAACQTKHCVGVANGTDALFLTFKALGIGPGDEVIVPANSFIASSESVSLTGARVVFADIDPRTYNIDPEQVEAQLTPATRAILAVHLYGQPVDMDPILEIARRRGLFVVEDAAQAHGAVYKGRMIGSLADAACFSFYPGKNLGAYGDGGAVVTSNDDLAARIRVLANHGRIDRYNHSTEGVNSRLDGIQAAVLNVKLAHLGEWTARRRYHAHRYSTLLGSNNVVVPFEPNHLSAVYHLYVVRVASDGRDEFRALLQESGIATGIHYPIALPNLAAYRYLQYSPGDFPQATRASQEVVSLPIYPELTDAEVDYVCSVVYRFLSRDSVTASVGGGHSA